MNCVMNGRAEKYDLEQENQSLSRRFTKDASELQNVIRTLRQQVEELELENSQNIADEKIDRRH